MIANPPGRLTEERAYPTLRIWCPRDMHLLRAKLYFVFGNPPLSHRYAGYCLVAGDCKSPEHKEVRSFFDGGLQIRRNA